MYSDNRDLVINKVVDFGLLFVIGIYILIVDISKTTLNLDFSTHKIEHILIIALSVLAIARLIVLFIEGKLEQKAHWGFIIGALAVSVAYLGVWHENPANVLLILPLLTISTIGMDHSKILKVYIVAAATIIFTAIVMAWIGAIDNYVYIRDMTIRSSWGIKYPTDMMSLLFFLLLAVWVVYGNKGGLWYLVPGGILIIMSHYVADSRTGMMCGTLFIATVLTWYFLSRKSDTKFARAAEVCCCTVFPVLTVIMNGLVLAYRHGSSWAYKINELMSNRLYYSVQALNEHGVSLCGKPLEQVGWGGSVFARPDYNFVDISYVLLLLRYGIVALVVVNILWVLMTRHAFKVGDKRLALCLTLIAINCAIEHHIIQLNYDIFIAMPFAIMASRGVEENACSAKVDLKSFKMIAEKIAIVVCLGALLSCGALSLLPKARTLISLMNMDDSTRGRRILAIVVAIGIFAVAKAIGYAYSLILGFINRDNTGRGKQLATVTALFAAICLVVIGSNILINRGAERNDNILESERNVIETVQENKSGNLYVKGLPEIYQNKFGGISNSLFNGEELGRYMHTSVVMDRITDSPCFFNTGFLYTPISEKHALLTNDEPVIRALQNEGYHLTGYFPLERKVDMKSLAKKNDLENNSDDSITLHGEKEALKKGPRKDLRAGRYTITYNLSIDPTTVGGSDDEVCRLVTTFYKGEHELSNVSINRDKFDVNGAYDAEVVVEMPDAENTDFCVYPTEQNNVTVKGISYKKTPKSDTHCIYNEERIKIREEYYDLEGEPYDRVAGFFAKDIGYDNWGNINHEIYYDKENHKTLSFAGCAEVKKTFDSLHHVLHEDFYGTDGKRIALTPGQSSADYKYDENGDQIEARYYGINDEPILAGGEAWGGYHGLKRTFDESRRVVREDYFGTKGEPVMLKEGYASRTFEYDENGYRIMESYYDLHNRPVMGTAGYSIIKKQYDEFGRVIREEYYNADGKRITLARGQAALEYVYDEEGRARDLLYFDINNEPAYVINEDGGIYQRVTRSFDENGRVVCDNFIDNKGNPAILGEGYSSKKYEYDEKGNRIKETYLDANGNEVGSMFL